MSDTAEMAASAGVAPMAGNSKEQAADEAPNSTRNKKPRGKNDDAV